MHTPLKIDFSAGDVITPSEVEYSFRMLFEDRTLSIMAYNLETVLAEKLETLIVRGTTNSRMRDFYDIHVLLETQLEMIDLEILKRAIFNTFQKRGSIKFLDQIDLILTDVSNSKVLFELWRKYQAKFDYAKGIKWDEINMSVRKLADIMK